MHNPSNSLLLRSRCKNKDSLFIFFFVFPAFSGDLCGEIWHSTAIVLRKDARHVQTKSGSQYELIGPINDKLTLQHGITK